MLALEVLVEAAQPLPPHHREAGIHHVQVGHLDIAGIDVVDVHGIQWNAVLATHLLAHAGRTRGDAELTHQRPIDKVEAHTNVDRSDEHPSELQSLMRNSYAVF